MNNLTCPHCGQIDQVGNKRLLTRTPISALVLHNYACDVYS